ncbi:hypothetical protein QLX08_007032 [Tetragonisca angustula]|uniref:Uncharacterized protein n=1 Tax=Tetragonisca angustula TaxID=166442 RepID=A0AAW0ZRS0_9HYME
MNLQTRKPTKTDCHRFFQETRCLRISSRDIEVEKEKEENGETIIARILFHQSVIRDLTDKMALWSTPEITVALFELINSETTLRVVRYRRKKLADLCNYHLV